MSVDSSPPVQPPQLSPDGKWVWDGSQWRPVATAEATHTGVFRSWDGIQVEAPDPTAQFADAAAAPVQYQSQPAADYSYQQADEPGVPLWQKSKGPGKSLYLYPIAALAVLGMAMMVLNSVGYIQLPFVGSSSNTQPQAKPSPTPDFSGPESVRADRFLKTYFAPALSNLNQAVPIMDKNCIAILSTGCFDALNVAEQQAKKLVAAVHNADIPGCILAPATRLLSDVQAMDQGLQLAQKAFQDNSNGELSTGLSRFRASYQLMLADLRAANQAQKHCLTIEVPSWVP